MHTATKALILASLLSVGCSGEVGSNPADEGPNPLDPADPSLGPNPGGTNTTPTGTNTSPTGTNTTPTGTNTSPTGTTTPPTGPGPTVPGTTGPVPTAPIGECGVASTSQVPRLLNRQYDAVIRDLLGVTTVASNGNQPPSAFLVTDIEGNITSTAWIAYLDAAKAISAQVLSGPSRSKFIECEPAQAACLRSTVEAFGRKAFRRPLTTEEVDSFMRLDNLEPKGTPEQVAESILEAFLASPSFLMLPELAQEVDPSVNAIKLSQHEVATRLSMLLWGSIPDDVLSAAADANQLGTKEQVLEQARRMAQDGAKTGPLLSAFHRFYTAMDGAHWGQRDHDRDKFPAFTEALNPASMAEMNAFFAEIGSSGTFEDLYLSDVAYVNSTTAPIYGVTGNFTSELSRVELPAGTRPGFLTRVGFLASFSGFDATSPILRGAYINKHVLRINPGVPADENLGATVEGTFRSQREYVDALTGPDECAGCHHAVINPPGYVLEVYDSIGAPQTTDPLGGPINATADVTFGPGNTKTITSPHEMMAEIAASVAAKGLYAEQWVQFATGRGANANDACIVEGISTSLAGDNYPIRNMLVDTAQADFVRFRTVGQ